MTADLIDALHGFQGVTIRVRHPLAPASMRLLDTLGATVEIDPSAPECVRFVGKFSHALKPGGCAECRRVEREAAGQARVYMLAPAPISMLRGCWRCSEPFEAHTGDAMWCP